MATTGTGSSSGRTKKATKGKIVGTYKCRKVYQRKNRNGHKVYYYIKYRKKASRQKCTKQNTYETKLSRVPSTVVKFYK